MADWTCPDCGRAFARRGQSYSCGRHEVGYRIRTRFAWPWRPPAGVGRLPADAVALSLDLPERLASGRVREAVEARPGHWVHHVVLAGPGVAGGEVREWLRWAAGAGSKAEP